MRIAVLSDTHIPARAKTLRSQAWEIIKSTDAIIHAGDVLSREFLNELASAKPLHVVRGNNDVTLNDLPEFLELEFAGVLIAVIHDSGDKKARAARMRKKFPAARIVIFGHSHAPMNEEHDGLLLFNPGSPTDRRMQPEFTMGLLTLKNGNIQSEIITLERS